MTEQKPEASALNFALGNITGKKPRQVDEDVPDVLCSCGNLQGYEAQRRHVCFSCARPLFHTVD